VSGLRIGYFLSSEEYTPAELIEQSGLAEEAGFEGLLGSDPLNPLQWVDAQGQSPLVLVHDRRAEDQVTRLPVTTAVTAPTHAHPPAIIAQAVSRRAPCCTWAGSCSASAAARR
jgi:hypothetical protein